MIQNFILIIFDFFKSLGIAGSFLSMFIENLGIPLPTEIGYLIAQDTVNQGIHSYIFVLIILTLGHLTGATVSYFIGRYGHKYVERKLKKDGKLKRAHEKLQAWYENYGNITIFATRFIGYVRPWSSLIAGFAGVKFWPFFILTAVGSFFFNIMTLYFSSLFIVVWRNYAGYHAAIIVTLLVSFLGLLIYEVVSNLIKKWKGLKK